MPARSARPEFLPSRAHTVYVSSLLQETPQQQVLQGPLNPCAWTRQTLKVTVSSEYPEDVKCGALRLVLLGGRSAAGMCLGHPDLCTCTCSTLADALQTYAQ
jgi:hypothetical protein